jgi:hypothetical protein
MSDLDFQAFSTVQNKLQQAPNTIASAATIAPSTFMTYVTGTVAVATITPPVTGQHMLVLIYTDATPTAMTNTGNIASITVPTINLPTLMFYDPKLNKYYGLAGALT